MPGAPPPRRTARGRPSGHAGAERGGPPPRHRPPSPAGWLGHGAPPEGAPGRTLSTGHGVFHSGNLSVTERFTFVDADTISYRATISDPEVFTQPWTIEFNALRRAPEGHMLFEYACHEGNGRNLELMTGADVDAVRVEAK